MTRFFTVYIIALSWALPIQAWRSPEIWVNDNFASSPKSATPIGSYTSIGDSPSSLAFGVNDIAFPVELPSARGAILHNPFPSYSHRAGMSEWGRGWQSNIVIQRASDLGEVNCDADEYSSPWGRLQKSSIANTFYPRGLTLDIRIVKDGNEFTAHHPDGRVFRFTPFSATTWQLVDVSDREGHHTRFRYDGSRLTYVKYGGKKKFQYEIEFRYRALKVPLTRFESCHVDSSINELVSEIRMGHRTIRLTHDDMFLKSIDVEFVSGESLPPIQFEYGHAQDSLAKSYQLLNPQLKEILEGLPSRQFFARNLAFADFNQDGLVDIERGDNLTSYVQLGGGKFTPFVIPAKAGSHWMPAYAGMTKERRLLYRPSGIGDELAHLSIRNQRKDNGTLTTLITRNLDGTLRHQQEIFQRLSKGLSFEESTHLVDFNGDLRPDIVHVGENRIITILNRSQRSITSPFMGEVDAQRRVRVATGEVSWSEPIIQPIERAKRELVSNYVFVDLNGDGFVDLTGQVRGGLYVWYGRGDLKLETAPVYLKYFTANLNPYSHPDILPNFVDVNRDGQMDLLMKIGFRNFLFFNHRDRFIEEPFSGFDERREWAAATRLVNFMGNGNDQLTVIDFKLGYIYFDLNSPDTGLLTRIDNGQGIVHDLNYDWSSPTPGVPHLVVVPMATETRISGRGPTTIRYDFSSPVIDKKNGRPLGFSQVEVNNAVISTMTRFLTAPWSSPRAIEIQKKDLKVPSLVEAESFSWVRQMLDGIDYWQLVKQVKVYVDNSTEYFRQSHEVKKYQRLCPEHSVEITPRGTLEKLMSYFDDRRCHSHITRIASPAFDFDLVYEITRNVIGQPTMLKIANVTQTEVEYDNDWNVRRVHEAGRGKTQIDYDDEFEIQNAMIFPDGLVERITHWDPIADGAKNVSTTRNRQAEYVQGFSYDDLGRLKRIWDDLGGIRGEYNYRLASHNSPAIVDDSIARTSNLYAADGSPLTSAKETQRGFAYGRLNVIDNDRVTGFSLHGISTEPTTTKLYESDGRLDEERITDVVIESPLWGLSRRQFAIDDAQANTLTRRPDISTGELRTTTTENSRFLTTLSKSEYVDELGARYQYDYDVMDRLRRIALPSGDVHAVEYDAFGRKSRITRSNVGEVNYVYDDANNRLKSKSFVGVDGKLIRDERYEYDDAGRVKSLNDFLFTYDGQFVSEVKHVDFTKQFSHASDGKILSKTLIEKSGASVEIQIDYDSRRRVKEEKVNRFTKRFEYDDYNDLKSIHVGEQVFSIRRNHAGKIFAITLPAGGEFKIDYDPLTGGRTGFHTPDTSTWWHYNDRGLITDVNAISRTKWQSFHHAYHDDKRLIFPRPLAGEGDFDSSKSGEGKFVLDENRHRIAKYRNGQLEYLHFDGVTIRDGHVYEKLTIEGIDIGILVDGRFRPVLFDQVGSVIADGDYFSVPTPYGLRDTSYGLQDVVDYAGLGRDRDTGLVRMGERDYDPQTGKFTSPDMYILESPEKCVESPQECDLYSYARGNPLLYTDRSGQIVDIALDVGFAAMSAYDFAREPSVMNGVALGLDIAGMAIPFATGMGRAFKAAHTAENAVDGLMATDKIRFSHDKIKDVFSDGSRLQDTIDSLKSGLLSPLDIKPIRIFEKDGLMFTLDNRRLLAAHLAGVLVNTVKATAQEIAEQAWKMTTKNMGTIVGVKGILK